MKSIRMLAVIGAVVLSATLTAQSTLSPEGLLRAAINREVIDGDVAGAVQQYQEIAKKYESNHAVASRALLQLGGLYEKQGNAEAKSTYQHIVNEYADAGATFTAARARLAGLQESAFPFKSRDVSSYFAGALFNQNSWSPDGRYFMYQKPTLGGLVLKEAATGKQVSMVVRPTETTLRFVWAPNSQTVVVTVRMSRELVEFRTISIPRGETRVIASSPARAGVSFAWSPDSRKLAFLSGSAKPDAFPDVHVVTLAPKPSAPANLGSLDTNSSIGIVWAPDGSRVAFMTPGSGNAQPSIRVVDVSTQEAKSIQTPPLAEPHSRNTIQAWTRANQIMIRQTVTNGADDYMIDVSGAGTPRKICESQGGFGGDGCQGLSPDGTLQIVRQNVNGGGRIVLRNTTTGADRPLTNEMVGEQTINYNGPYATSGSFSPDGGLFVFLSNRDGKAAWYVVPVGQIPVANPLRIGNLWEGATSGRWTGNDLVFAYEENPLNIFRIDLDPQTGQPSGPIVRLTQDTMGNKQAYISPDGRRVAYVSRWQYGRAQVGVGFCLMDANGQRERLVHEVAPDRLDRMTLVGWRSNDELLISDLGAGPLAPGGYSRTLMVLNLTTNELRAAGTPTAGAGLPPSDRRVRVFDKAPVLERPPAGVDFDWSTANKSPDGSFIVLEGSKRQVKWQRIENITYDAVVKLTSEKK